MRVPVGFINASGVGRGAMIETGLREKLSFSAESSSNESFSGMGEFVAVVPRLAPVLSASEEPKNENLLLETGTLKFGVIMGSFPAFDGPVLVSLWGPPSMSTASNA